jgi:LacI family transcriptional regulator
VQVEAGRVQDKVTLADVAREAGVSAMTVSRVVNERPGVAAATRRRVRRAIETLGYRPNIVARGLKAARSHTLGLLVPDITNPYFPAIVRGAEDVAFAAGYTVLLNNVIEDVGREAAALQAFEDRRVDGVIAVSPRLPEERLHELLGRCDAAVVINRRAPASVAGSVRVDHEHGAQLGVRHLRAGGCRRIGVLAGPPESHAGHERRRGIAAELERHGLRLADADVEPGPPTLDGGARAAAALLRRRPELDGLMCFNDLVAAGALQALAEHGRRVPDDVAVVGYDDIPFARMFTPPLTTLHVPTYELGAHAMRMLLTRMDGRQRSVGIVVQPELVVRGSTRAATAAPVPDRSPA